MIARCSLTTTTPQHRHLFCPISAWLSWALEDKYHDRVDHEGKYSSSMPRHTNLRNPQTACHTLRMLRIYQERLWDFKRIKSLMAQECFIWIPFPVHFTTGGVDHCQTHFPSDISWGLIGTLFIAEIANVELLNHITSRCSLSQYIQKLHKAS